MFTLFIRVDKAEPVNINTDNVTCVTLLVLMLANCILRLKKMTHSCPQYKNPGYTYLWKKYCSNKSPKLWVCNPT